VRKYFPYHHRQNLECLRRGACRERESALDVFEVESIGLVLLLDLFDEATPQFRLWDGALRSDDQISLPAHRHQTALGASVAVRGEEIFDWHARHQKIL